jgi:formate dehydrogenase maturation protein FdhE
MAFVIALVIVIAVMVVLEQRPQAQMKRRARLNQANARPCPHCGARGQATLLNEYSQAPKLLLGIFAVGAWKVCRCGNCGYKY